MPTQFVNIAGEPIGNTVQEKLRALDADAFGDVELAEGQAVYYNPEKAKEYIAKAREALEAEGVTFPIHLDMPVRESAEIAVNQVKSLKSTIEAALGTDNVIVDIQLLNDDKYYAAIYDATTGSVGDFDYLKRFWLGT